MSRPRALRRKCRRERACSGDRPGDRRARPNPSPRSDLGAEQEPTAWVVADDWPEIAPVKRAEIDVIETWLADLLDGILSPRR